MVAPGCASKTVPVSQRGARRSQVHKAFDEEDESRNNHPYAVVVQDLATQWVQSYPCQNKDFTGDGKEFTKVPRAFTKAKSYLHGQLIHWSLANLVKFHHGIIELQRLIDQRQMALQNEP